MSKSAKRVVINRQKKNIDFSLHNQNHNQSHKSNIDQPSINQHNNSKILKERDYYKSKSQVYLIKCKFLSQKLTDQGISSDIPNDLLEQIQTIDIRMRKLQSIISQKRAKYLIVLKNKISSLFHEIQFQSAIEGLSSLQNELDIMSYLMQMFRYRYNEMVNQMNQVDQIVEQLKQQTQLKNHNSNYIKQINMQNQALKEHIKDLEKQIFTINKMSIQSQKRGNEGSQKSQQIYKHQIDSLQAQNKQLKKKLMNLQNEPTSKDIQVQKLKRIIDELQSQIKGYRVKIQLLEQDISMFKRQEYKWKTRFSNMQKQKQQRINILQKQIGQNHYLIDNLSSRQHTSRYQDKYYNR